MEKGATPSSPPPTIGEDQGLGEVEKRRGEPGRPPPRLRTVRAGAAHTFSSIGKLLLLIKIAGLRRGGWESAEARERRAGQYLPWDWQRKGTERGSTHGIEQISAL